MDEAEIAGGCFVISGGETARVLQAVDATLDSVSEGVDEFIDEDRRLAVLAAWNDRLGSAPADILANVVGIKAAVGDDDLWIGSVGLHHEVVALVVRDLAAGDFGRDREAFGVCPEVDFGGETAFRPAETLFLSPPFAPAA